MKCSLLGRGEKPCRSEYRSNKFSPHTHSIEFRIEPEPHEWQLSALTSVPSLPQIKYRYKCCMAAWPLMVCFNCTCYASCKFLTIPNYCTLPKQLLFVIWNQYCFRIFKSASLTSVFSLSLLRSSETNSSTISPVPV